MTTEPDRAGRRTTVRTGSPIPARLRIVAWITLATSLVLLAVVLTVRSALLTDVEDAANESVQQEVDEFRTFAAEGRDPETGGPFASAGRLLELYLQRQFPGRAEVFVGYDAGVPAGTSPLVVQDLDDRYGLLDDPDLVAELVESEAASGIAEVDGRSFRWGTAEVVDRGGVRTGELLVAAFVEPGRAEVARTTQLIVGVSLGGLLLTAGIAFVVAGQILAPVRTVRRAAARITRADLSRRIEVRGRDDLAALASTFNSMLDRLEGSFRSQRHFVRVADRHIRGPVDLLADPTTPPEDRARAARRIRSTLDDMALLTSSQLPGFADPADVEVARLGDDLARAAAGAAPDHDWELRLTGSGAAHVDPGLLRAATVALAENAAAEHAGPRPLRLGVEAGATHLDVWVEDDGPGLAEEQAQHVLDRYTDLADDDAGGPDAPTGLGLAVVRAVADAHDGSAWVETAPGEGARFGVRVPLGPPVPARSGRRDATRDEDTRDDTAETTDTTTGATSGDTTGDTTATGAR
ncbi:sensor histidine kinase [Nocardioides litoris]|uniref:sensor histidine kinase n=1 Tax=Nocardioides litoris TaxID=1926648 RepID=UPI001476FF5C|nr:HAMP domain-containing sensor histidine kinase [Nocardioides litoris]